MMIKNIFLYFYLALSISFAHAETTLKSPPDVFVQNVINEVIASLNADPVLVQSHEKLSVYVEANVMSQFDVAYMAKQIVGQQAFNAASETDVSNLTDELKLFYVHFFTKTLSEYKNQTVKFYPFEGNADADEASVNGQLFEPGDETISFNFRLKKYSSGWKVINISVGGIDLIKTYQSNFKSIVRDGGVARLVAELHKKNLALAAMKSK
jgi:phospholipid transport system substrate-binding protein